MPVKNIKNNQKESNSDDLNVRETVKSDSSAPKKSSKIAVYKGEKGKTKEPVDKLEENPPTKYKVTQEDTYKFIHGVDKSSISYGMSEKKGKALTEEEKEETLKLLHKAMDFF